MSELRWHPFLEEWVITATHRQERTFLPPKDYCPLCPTKPGGFPTEVPREDYDIVVFENKFPSFRSNPSQPVVEATTVSPVKPAQGICEVVLYSSEHSATLTTMPLTRIRNLLLVWQDRYRELSALDFIKYVLIFENKGEAVGVTLHHPHGQIYAFPFVPPKIEKELDASAKYYQNNKQCLFCATLEEEYRDGRRIVFEGEKFVAFIPFFARYPYETYLAPKKHRASMNEFIAEDLDDLALTLKGLLVKYDSLFNLSFPYIMVIHQAPTDGKDYPDYHFHFEFYPPLRAASKLKYLAGCESGAGNYINDTLAEEKAAELREIGPKNIREVLALEK
ncbi:MAG: galactose-1-phosphate uridylyltransferase [Firmicutes bacterium]|nr:galactose-1-phosphate uridylyltransferase [Bacillota bacterium]